MHGSRRNGVARRGFALATALAAMLAGSAAARAQEVPVDPGSLDGRGSSTEGSPLQIHGFAVADYRYDAATGEDSFDTSALALSLFRSTLGSRLSLFGQLTVHRPEVEPFVGEEGDALAAAEGEGGGEASFETEIDNLLIRWVVSPKAGLALTFGKFDSPLAIERDDAPLNYQATPSFLLDFGRPIKLTGLMLREAFSPSFQGFAIVADGAEEGTDAKTGALYGRWSPSLASHLGLGVIYDDGAGRASRTTGVATLLLQPRPSWVVGGEAVAGSEERREEPGSDRWSGATLFVHHRFGERGQGTGRWAATVRGELFDDPAGARTGVAQRLTALTVSPQYLVGGGFYGVFHYLEGTSLRLPELAVRLDLRWDRSDQEVFAGGGEMPRRDRTSAALQLVYVF